MKQSLRIILFLLFICGFSACKKDNTQLAQLEIANEELVTLQQPFLQGADNRTIPISTTLSVTKVSSSESWCKVSIIENDGTFLRVAVSPNEGFEERTAEVILFGQGVPEIKILITQWGNKPSLVVAETEDIHIEDGHLEFSLQITSNVDFTITIPEWVQDQGDNIPIVGNKVYKFIATAIMPGERIGEIQIITEDYEDLNRIIPITQSQKVLVPVLTTFSPITEEKGEIVILHGENFGNSADIVEVFFNDKNAEVVSVENNMIKVLVPQAPGEDCSIEVLIGGGTPLVYGSTFEYKKSWSLSTLVGNGNAAFKAGTLDQGQLKARYISMDGNGNIFASHRDEGTNRHVVRINEAENIVESVASFATPNGSCVGPDGTVYVASDGGHGKTYYKLDPNNNWTPVEQTITYQGNAPLTTDGGSYWYRLVYNEKDNHLYGVIGNIKGQMIKINPATNQGSIVYEWGAHPYWYAFTIDPLNKDMFYAMVNSATVGSGFGIYELDSRNISTDRFMRLNSSAPAAAASAATLNDGSLVNAGFGQAWDMVFKDGKLYVSDNANHLIRKIDLQTKTVETIVGIAGSAGDVDGKKGVAKLNNPRGLVWNNDGTALYISDFGNSKIRKWAFD